MLFLDTWHSYKQVNQELLQAQYVNKYIAFHDTILYGKVGSGGEKGILYAIDEFLFNNRNWHKIEENTDGNGMIIIAR